MSYDYRNLELAYDALPSARIPGLRAHWLQDLVLHGFGEWVEELSAAAYGPLEDRGWRDVLHRAPTMLEPDGTVRRAWCDAMRRAAGLLAEAGARSGPESNRERWVSWLVWSLSEPRRFAAHAQGSDAGE